MRLLLTIDCNGPAFEGDRLGLELSSILGKARDWAHDEGAPAILVDGERSATGALRDSKGNRVAEIVLTTEE